MGVAAAAVKEEPGLVAVGVAAAAVGVAGSAVKAEPSVEASGVPGVEEPCAVAVVEALKLARYIPPVVNPYQDQTVPRVVKLATQMLSDVDEESTQMEIFVHWLATGWFETYKKHPNAAPTAGLLVKTMIDGVSTKDPAARKRWYDKKKGIMDAEHAEATAKARSTVRHMCRRPIRVKEPEAKEPRSAIAVDSKGKKYRSV